MKRPVQILSVVFALGMLGGYVVFSQLQHQRNVAPSSKVMKLDLKTNPGALANATNTSNLQDSNRVVMLPGSKALSPVLTVPPTLTVQSPAPSDAPAPVFFGGSKSGMVLTPERTKAFFPAPSNAVPSAAAKAGDTNPPVKP